MSRKKDYSLDKYSSTYRGEQDQDDVEEGHQQSQSAKLGDRVTFLTRALVKNNIVGQNAYLVLLGLEYLSMLYYILRLVDNDTLNKGFQKIEMFLDPTQVNGYSYDEILKMQQGINSNKTLSANSTLYSTETLVSLIQAQAYTHIVINCSITGSYLVFLLLFIHKLFKVDNFDKTQEQSYFLKGLSFLMVLSKTILKLPILSSVFIVANIINENLQASYITLSIISNTILVIEFLLIVVYSLKFFNLEVPNDDIAWSHNTNNGIYFKLLLKITLASQELYRDQLHNQTVSIIVITFILVLQFIIISYRMNTPNIFNTVVHDFTLFLEAFIISLTLIGLIALITSRDILSTMAYLCIFIPVILKIFFSIDQSRKHYVLFKLKNEENLSQNEYLIALTSLLKMIKRQNETDLAQLLSFTYYHKLYCYDTDCICQFFTQYCQDPQKFKLKKKRTYRKYKDDGFKMIQIVESESNETNHTIASLDVAGTQANPNEGGERKYMGNVSVPVLQKGGPRFTNKQQETGFDSASPGEFPGGGNSGGAGTLNNQNNEENVNENSQQIDYSGYELNGAVSKYDYQASDQHQKEQADDEHSNNAVYGVSSQNMYEYQESGLKAQYVKNGVLKGNAFNGFDTNMDFKIKGEFKSPSQFKNTEESRTYFFTRLLETMFKQLEQMTNKNTSFTLISIYFHFFYQHNIYLAAISLIKLTKALNRSTLEKMTFSVTEFYLLELIMNHFKHNTKDEINYQQFIDISQMQQRLDWLFEDSSQEIVQFWRLFKEEQANVQRSYHLAMNISKNIAMIRDYTNQLEEKQLIKDYNKYYYYAMFYQNLLNDRQSYNQMINNLRNLLMVKNMQKKNSRFGITNSDINDVGFAIMSLEDGTLMERKVGKFLYCNKAACMTLNISEEEVIGKTAGYIMPELIRGHHDYFIKRFLQDGLTRFLGKVRNMYIKDFTGYIKPVQLFFNFYYSSKFSYTFIMHIDPIHQFTYFGSPSMISAKHVMIFLCSQHNSILNMSESVRKILGLSFKRIKEEEEILGREIRMDDIILQFGFIENMIAVNKFTFMPNQLVKVRNFRGEATAAATTGFTSGSAFANDQSYLPCSLTFEETVYLKEHQGRFTEKVYILIPSTKVPELDINTTAMTSVANSQQVNDPGSGDVMIESNTAGESLDDPVNNNISPSCSSMTSSSSGTSTSGIASTKNLLFQQKSPKILNLYLTIVFSVFFSFIVITSINFIIYIQKKNYVNLQITVNQIVSERNVYMSATILDLKQLHLISQKSNLTRAVNANFSNILPAPNNTDRFGEYNMFLLADEENLQTNHEAFKQNDHRYSSLTRSGNFSQNKNIQYKLISDLGKPYYQNNTLDYGIQLLISNLALIKSSSINQEALPLNLDLYLQRFNGSAKVSQLLKNLYYVYYNGMGRLNSLIQKQSELMQSNTVETSKNNNLFINLISFISIGMITFIGVFTFPMLGKIEDRKISVLKFFNLLNIDQIQELIKKGEDYQQEFAGIQRGVNSQSLADRDNDTDSGMIDFGSSDDATQMADEYGLINAKAWRYRSNEQNEINIKVSTGTPTPRHEMNNVSPQKNQKAQIRFAPGIGTSLEEELKKSVPSRSYLNPADIKNAHKKSSMSKSIGNKKKFTGDDFAAQGIREIFHKIKLNETNQSQTSIQRKRSYKYFNGDVNTKSSIKNSKQKQEDQEEELKVSSIKHSKRGSAKHDSGDKKKSKKNQDDVVRGNNMVDQENSNSETSVNSEDEEKEKKHKKGRKGAKNLSNEENNSASGSQQNGINRMNHINEQLEKVAMKEKVKLAFYVFMVLAFLNSCLIACYVIGQKTFSEDSQAVYTLSIFYHRQNCLDNLLLYSMEQFIQNSTIKIEGYSQDAVTHYLDYCQFHEQEFNDIRRSIPVFLAKAQSQIESLESSNLCRTIYRAADTTQIASCESVYDEIMKRGLTSTLYTIFNYAQSLNVRFSKELRTREFLNKILYEDQKFRDLIDLVKSYLKKSFNYIQTVVTDCAINYFDELANIYMIIYGCYMGISILMCLVFGLFVFKTLRQQIITSANILAIMPLEEIETRDRQKIEAFLNS